LWRPSFCFRFIGPWAETHLLYLDQTSLFLMKSVVCTSLKKPNR
jgi:hypothetical protein